MGSRKDVADRDHCLGLKVGCNVSGSELLEVHCQGTEGHGSSSGQLGPDIESSVSSRCLQCGEPFKGV